MAGSRRGRDSSCPEGMLDGHPEAQGDWHYRVPLWQRGIKGDLNTGFGHSGP